MAKVKHKEVLQWWLRSRKLIAKDLRRGFDSLFLVSWLLWKKRNARTFNNAASKANQLAARIEEEANEWSMAGYRHLRSLLVLL